MIMPKTPLCDAVFEYVSQKTVRFHMPGHKGKPCGNLPPDWFLPDITELDSTDNLLAPTGCIDEAQKLCAKDFGAAASFFTTGGATCGILAMFAASVKRGERVLMDRACHLSAYHALSLCGGVPFYIRGDYDSALGITMPPTPAAVQAAMDAAPDAKTLFITSPNAFGFCADLPAIAALCKERGITLLVDEAHGAHYAVATGCPPTAMAAGADMCVQSFHKTLPALTGAAVMHVGTPCWVHRADRALRLFQSTSPSYLLLASIDAARDAAKKSAPLWETLLKTIREEAPQNVLPTNDPYRITVCCNGEETEKILKENGIVPEMVTPQSAVFIVTMQDTKEDLQKLFSVIKDLPPVKKMLPAPPVCPMRFSPTAVWEMDTKQIPLRMAEGYIAAEPIYRYPPATAILAPGEELTKEMCAYLCAHPDMPQSIRVIENS